MKKTLLLFIFLAFGMLQVHAQIIAYHENFELPSLDDSVTYSSNPTAGLTWHISTRLYQGAGSLRSDSCQVQTGATVYMTTAPFNTTGNTLVLLDFAHICKVDFLDIATLEVSNNGGSTWTQLTSAQYLGTGQYGGNGNRFASNSYANLWQPSSPTAIPQNTWWRFETFDLSFLLPNCPNAMIRFKLADGGTPGPNNNRGWFIDNVKVTMAQSELTPPVITLVNPIATGLIWSTGPFSIKAHIVDPSGIDTARVVYSVNGGPADTVGMTHIFQDTMVGIIPTVNDSDVVCWYVDAFDASLAHNWARNPVSTCITFTARAPLTFPFDDNFSINNDMWIPSYGGANTATTWEHGSPTYGVTNTTHSPPYVWDVNLTTSYQNSAYCILTSPVFNFTTAVDARLVFWANYETQNGVDGVRLEYTTNGGATWTLLGSINDPLGENWYPGNITSTSQPGWSGNSNGWKKFKYKLSVLNNSTNKVRFRFIFNSNTATVASGFSIDDFSITLPSPQEASCNSITSPGTGCGLGNETVTIKIINTGLTPITSGLTASYKKNNWAPVVTEAVTGTINPNDTLTFTFATPANLYANMADSVFNIKAWVTLVNDPNHGDDTTYKQIQSKFTPIAPVVTSVLIPYGTLTTITASAAYPITWWNAPTGGTSLGTGPTYTTPILYGTTIYYPSQTAPNACPGIRAKDTVYVGQAPPYDGATLAVPTPITGINLTATEVVRSHIRNYGTADIWNFPVSYRINNGPVVTELVPDTLHLGDTMTYAFTTPANLFAFGIYQLKVWISVPGDGNHINDTISKTIECKLYPYCESRATSTIHSDIGNVTLSNLNNGNPNPSLNNPASTNLYTSFLNLAPVQLSRGQSYPVSVSQISATTFYAACVKIYIDWNYDGVFDEPTETVFSSGPTTSAMMTLAGTINVPVTARLGLTLCRVVLEETTLPANVHPCGTYTYGETEDYFAFISPQIPNDAGILSFVNPPNPYLADSISPIEVVVGNFGTLPITSVGVTYKLDNNPPVTQTWTGNLAAMANTTVTFPAISFPAGYHSLCAYTTLAGDSNTFNDTLCISIQGIPVDSLPYYDNFDGTPVKFYPSVSTGTNWIHGSPNSGTWPDPAYSPPNVWATNLNMTGYTASALCYLSTQAFKFSNAVNAKVSFWYNTDMPATGDGVTLQYSLNAGATWLTLGVVNDPLGINWYTSNITGFGPGWVGNSGGWKKATFLLSNFSLIPHMRFRFAFYSNTTTQQRGFAFDNFQITIPYHQDAGADSILTPQGQAVGGTNLAPNVRLTNFGMDTLYSVNLFYTINGGTPIPGIWTGTLNPGTSTTFQFTSTYVVPNGDYILKVYTDLPDDGDHVNDSSQIFLFGIPTFEPPYEDDFNATVGYWYTNGTQWERGSPTSALINFPYSPPSCWKTNLDGIYVRTAQKEFLYSPMFNFSTSGYDSLVFYHWAHIYQDDGATLEYLSTNGWKTLGWLGDPSALNWYANSNTGWTGFGVQPGWHKSSYYLGLIGDFASPTQFRFAFDVIFINSLFDGWAVDNFKLTSPKIPRDAGVTAILQPVGQTTYGTDMVVQVRIRNFGTDTLYSVPVKFQINGVTENAGTWTGILYPDSSKLFTFLPHPSPLHDYKLCAYTDLTLDAKFSNDTSCSFLTVTAPAYDLLVTQITQPVSQTIHGDSATVKIILKNVGQNPVSDIPLAYRVADSMIVVEELLQLPTPMMPGDSVFYTFSTRYSYEFLGFYTLCSYTDYANDGYHKNDTLCKVLEELYTSVPEHEGSGIFLSQNVPNPTGGNTHVMIRIPHSGQVTLEVVSLLGQKVFRFTEKMSEGDHLIQLETSTLPSGIYYYYLVFDHTRFMRKMMIAK